MITKVLNIQCHILTTPDIVVSLWGKPIITMIDRAQVLSFLFWVDSQAATASDCKSDTTVSEVRVLLYPPYVGIGEVVNTMRCERIMQECESLISTQIIYWAHLAAIK